MKIINSYRSGDLQAPNTFIGGVGATSVTSASDFAAKAGGITTANIFNFQINSDNDVSFFVDATYTLGSAFIADTDITYFFDYDGKCTGLGNDVFRGCTNIKVVALYGTTSCVDDNFINSLSYDVIYLPVMIPFIGDTSGNEGNFSTSTIENLYVHVDIETNNGGSPDLDIIGATNVSTISYIANTTKPSDITDLAVVSDAFAVTLQFDWTAPSSSNAIDYYEIYVGGHYRGRTTSLNFLLTGLTLNTSYSIQVNAVDIYYNHGSSNTLVLTTNATYNIPTGNIISYYPLNSNSNDFVGTNDGTDTSISYISGLISNSADFGGGTSKIDVADDNTLSFVNAGDLPFSYSLWVKFDVNQNSMFIDKRDATFTEYQVHYSLSDGISFDIMSGGSISNFKREKIAFTPTIGTWYYITCAYSGSGRQKIYLDGVLQATTEEITGTYVGMTNTTAKLRIGKGGWSETSGVWTLNGLMDEVSIFDIELSAIQIIEIKAKNDDNLGLTD